MWFVFTPMASLKRLYKESGDEYGTGHIAFELLSLQTLKAKCVCEIVINIVSSFAVLNCGFA